MTAATSVASELGIYACPVCKCLLRQEEGELRCPTCSQSYSIREGIPDFVLEELSRSTDPVLCPLVKVPGRPGGAAHAAWFGKTKRKGEMQ